MTKEVIVKGDLIEGLYIIKATLYKDGPYNTFCSLNKAYQSSIPNDSHSLWYNRL